MFMFVNWRHTSLCAVCFVLCVAVYKSESGMSANGSWKTNEKNEPYYELTSKKRVSVSEYRKQKYVGVREYYEKDGKMLPGRKGVNLNKEQFEALVAAAPLIDQALNTLQ